MSFEKLLGNAAADRNVGQVTIDVLPDDVLLDIFDFCLNRHQAFSLPVMWPELVKVCQRWRNVVFQSPRRLCLQILCTSEKPVREKLDIWPALPLFISINQSFLDSHMKDVIAAFKHRDRIYTISIACLSSLKSLLHLMLEPFPALKSLDFEVWGNAPDDPDVLDSFLGGSAPHLQHLDLTNMPFPALPTLLLSVTDLVTLTLRDVPPSVYISPEVMITCLSAWTRLERFMLLFRSPRSHPDQESRLSSSKTCAALPVLTSLDFTGRNEYFEELVARIDVTPLLDRLNIGFFDQPTYHTPCLGQFISRAPKFQVLTEASVAIIGLSIHVTVPPPPQAGQHPQAFGFPVITLNILDQERDWQPSTLTRLCTESLPLFHTVEYFCMIYSPCSRNIKNTEWLELLRLFATVKNLYLSKSYAPRIIPALDESELFEKSANKVLSALKNIFLVDFSLPKPTLQALARFRGARRRSGNPIDVSSWKGGGSLYN